MDLSYFKMLFRENFWRRLSGSFGPKPLPRRRVSADEPLARYVFGSLASGKPKTGEFLPNPKEGLTTSVFRVEGLVEEEIWTIGRTIVGPPRGAEPKAFAQFAASVPEKFLIQVVPECSIHARHANLQNWPANKEEQKVIANELRAKCMCTIAT